MTATATATALPVATVPVVRAYVRRLLNERRGGSVLGISAQPKWTGPDTLTVDGATVHVRACVSALAVREAMLEHAERDEGYLVVITDVEDLGHGITARLARGRLLPVQLWQAVRDAFAARDLDPLLVNTDKDWAPRALVDYEPAGGWPAVPSGTLTRNFALGHLARTLLGDDPDGNSYLDGEHPDAEGLMRWSADATAVRRWLELPDDVPDGLSRWLESRTGPAGTWTLRAVAAGHARDAVALGLVAGLLWHEEADAAVAGVGRGMLRSRLGGRDLPYADARAWARTAASYVAAGFANGETAALTTIHRAEELLGEFGAQDLVKHSDLLEGAFVHRLRAFATAVSAALPSPVPSALGRAEDAFVTLWQHEAATPEHNRARTATMALRLLRWLAAAPRSGARADRVDTLADALDRQVRVDAWVDRAVSAVWSGDPDPKVGAAYRSLAELVLERRADHDEQLARLLATVTEEDADLGRIVPVEDLMASVVRPLAAKRPVLLVVVDGMSTGVMTEVTEGLRSRRWVELVSGETRARQAILPALPTLTGVSRTSLLTGKLQRGSQATERSEFEAATGQPSLIFHKGDLRAPAGDTLAPDVRDAVRSDAVRVVGVVLNTVDDTLDKLDPGSTLWGVDAIQHLEPLLEVARQTDRVVVLTSDHGHVVERGSEYRAADGAGARWRPASSGPPGDGEVAVQGRRVLLGGGDVVLSWREQIRYVPAGGGYHGGASAAEVAVPLSVHVFGAVDELAGWVPGSPPEPAWWNSPLAPARPTIAEPPRPAPAAPKREEAAPTLFDQPEGAPEADPVTSLVDALLASDVYATQRKRVGRVAPDDARVRAILEALLRNDGRLHSTTLASVAQIPVSRMTTVLAATRRLLSVDGYEALTPDADGVTMLLDVPLLREQFGLGGSP
ncbi:MAG: BREX-2 system phosphatase PglZ [bacterium]